MTDVFQVLADFNQAACSHLGTGAPEGVGGFVKKVRVRGLEQGRRCRIPNNVQNTVLSVRVYRLPAVPDAEELVAACNSSQSAA